MIQNIIHMIGIWGSVVPLGDVFWVHISYSTFDFSILMSIFLDSLTWMGLVLEICRACVANCVLCLSVLWRVVLSIFSLDFPAGWLGPLLHSAEPDPLLLSEMWSWVRAGGLVLVRPSGGRGEPGWGCQAVRRQCCTDVPPEGGWGGLQGIRESVRAVIETVELSRGERELSGRRGGEVISSKRAQRSPFGPPSPLLVLTNPFVHSILSPRSFFDICKPDTLPYPTSPP